MTDIAQLSTAEWVAAVCLGALVAGFIIKRVSRTMRRRADSLQTYFDLLEGNVMPGFTEDQHRFINERMARIRAASGRSEPLPRRAHSQYRGKTEHPADAEIIALWPKTPPEEIAVKIGYSIHFVRRRATRLGLRAKGRKSW